MDLHVRHVAAAVLRASCFPAHPERRWPDLTGEGGLRMADWVGWLREVWSDQALVLSIEAASPELAEAVEAVCCGGADDPRRVRRVVQSVAHYLLRAEGRATPFGYFAGVSALQVGERAEVIYSGGGVTARPGAGWLAAVIRALEADREVLRQLPVVVNSLAFTRADRYVLTCQMDPAAPDGAPAATEVTIRRLRAVDVAMGAAKTSATITDLAALVLADQPAHRVQTVEGMLARLVEHRFLISALNPPTNTLDPLAHLLDQLRHLYGQTAANATAALCAVADDLSRLEQADSPAASRALHRSTITAMSAVCPRPSIAVDARAQCRAVLPEAVAAEAASAATALIRLAPDQRGTRAWREWHERFLERYGVNAVIPVLTAVDPDVGIGYPAGYRGAPVPAGSTLTDRDRLLLAWIQQVAMEGRSEIVLDQDAISRLEGVTAPGTHAVPHAEVRFSIYAPSTAAIDRGDFTLVVVSAARQAGTTIGRFLHLLPAPEREAATLALAGVAPLNPGALHAQVSIPPLLPQLAQLTRNYPVFASISACEYRVDEQAEAAIGLADLALTADSNRLRLLRLSDGTIVEPVMFNAVSLGRLTHPTARFLTEVTTSSATACRPFDWGAARDLPFLPRLRHGRSVLMPARWIITAAHLPGPHTSWKCWAEGFDALRRIWRLPRYVFLGENDIRLALDLDETAHLALVRRRLTTAGKARLTETAEPGAYDWLGGRAHEVALPISITTATKTSAPRPQTSRPLATTDHRGHAPGVSPWLYARLLAHPDRHTDILTRVPELLADWSFGPAHLWWYLRYHEPETHLRVRIPLHRAQDYGSAAMCLGAWGEKARTAGLIRAVVFDTYYPETGRFGHGALLDAAHAVFAADSAAALVQTTGPAAGNTALTIASLTDAACAFTGSTRAGMRWLVEHFPRHPATSIDRNLRNEALHLADPSDDWAALRALPDAAGITAAWGRRAQALAAYRAALQPGGPEPDTVLAALLHLHHARTHGIAADHERLCRDLARAAALAWIHRKTPGAPR